MALRFLCWLWKAVINNLRALGFALGRVRVTAVVILATGLLLHLDQGQDLLISITESGFWTQSCFVILASLLGLSAWWWPRFLLEIRYASLPTLQEERPLEKVTYSFWRKVLPRILGSISVLMIAHSVSRAVPQDPLVRTMLVSTLVVFLLVWLRRPALRRLIRWESGSRLVMGLQSRLDRDNLQPIDRKADPKYYDWQHASDSLKLPFRRFLLDFQLLALALLALLSTILPVATGTTLGTASLLFLWGILIQRGLSQLTHWADQNGFPLFTIAFLSALASSAFNDDHQIPVADSGLQPRNRPDVATALVDWAESNRVEACNSEEKANCDGKPFLVVAAAGGGIRAAYWSATILGRLHHVIPAFDTQLFAISGVSGGSVGASVYRAMLEHESNLPECRPAVNPGRPGSRNEVGNIECLAQKILGQDFLGPIGASLLTPDLVKRLQPFPIEAIPDRGDTLERAWEKSFHAETGRDTLRDTTLLGLSRDVQRPAVFLNSTWVENGRRIVASNLAFDKGDLAQHFERSNDLMSQLGHDLRLSSAAHNSARFPYVSPPGHWKRYDPKEEDFRIAGRLQDGGLFENYGAETALEILAAACEQFQCSGTNTAPSRMTGRIIPIVILITSDPSLPETLAESPKREPNSFAYEIASTPTTYANTRTGRGAEAAARLEEWAHAHRPDQASEETPFFHFKMCEGNEESTHPPLGWTLSKEAQDGIRGYLTDTGACKQHNTEVLNKLMETISRR